MSKVADARTLEVLMLGLGSEVFAIEACCVREILDPVPVTAVPNARPFVDGLINVRGKVVPLADPRLLFGMTRTPPTPDTRIVVIEADLDGEPTLVGLITDKVYEVTELAAASLEEVPRVGMRWRPDLIRCIGLRGDGFVMVVDLAKALTEAIPSRADA
jgi:purine-binding chemotaxis protein CheW